MSSLLQNKQCNVSRQQTWQTCSKSKIEREEASRHFIRRYPYPHQVIQKKKKKTLNRNGMSLLTFPCNINYDEHVRNFLDVMRLHVENNNLCLGQFSKSLIDMAYLWYTTRPIKPWYFHVDDKFILLNFYDEKQEQLCRFAVVPSNLLLYLQIYYSTSIASAVQTYIVMSNMRNVSQQRFAQTICMLSTVLT